MQTALDRLFTASCDETAEHLSEHVEGTLGRLRRRRVLRHLGRCERCRAVLASLRRTIQHLRSLPSTDLPGGSVADVVVARVRPEH